jgi:hypothetical protein
LLGSSCRGRRETIQHTAGKAKNKCLNESIPFEIPSHIKQRPQYILIIVSCDKSKALALGCLWGGSVMWFNFDHSLDKGFKLVSERSLDCEK